MMTLRPIRIPAAPVYVCHEKVLKVGIAYHETIYPMCGEGAATKLYRELKKGYPKDRVAIVRRMPTVSRLVRVEIGRMEK